MEALFLLICLNIKKRNFPAAGLFLFERYCIVRPFGGRRSILINWSVGVFINNILKGHHPKMIKEPKNRLMPLNNFLYDFDCS